LKRLIDYFSYVVYYEVMWLVVDWLLCVTLLPLSLLHHFPHQVNPTEPDFGLKNERTHACVSSLGLAKTILCCTTRDAECHSFHLHCATKLAVDCSFQQWNEPWQGFSHIFTVFCKLYLFSKYFFWVWNDNFAFCYFILFYYTAFIL